MTDKSLTNSALLFIKYATLMGVLGLAGCAINDEPTPVQTVASEPEPVVASEPEPVVASEPEPVVASEPEPVVANINNSVYFSFDSSEVQNQYYALIKSNSEYISTQSAKVQLQGNTDGIGSVEYNLALGQKRAEAVKRAMVADGASASAIEATSNGKSSPKGANITDKPERDALNRRVDVMYNTNQPNGYTMNSAGLPIVSGFTKGN